MTDDAHTASLVMNYLQSAHAEMVAYLKELVVIESPSHDASAQVDMLQHLAASLKELNFHTEYVPGKSTGGFLYARPNLRDKTKPLQLLVGHCDTVWQKNTIEQMPIVEENGKIRGPGIYDMKAGLTQLIFALKTIEANELNTSLCPIILINSDEEIGSRESSYAIERLAKVSERAFIMEPPLGLEGKLKTARKGVGRFEITVTGKAAHAGLDPGKGVNAIVELSHQVQRLYAMNDLDKGITVNVGTIQGGISPNVVAPESKAVVDVRVRNHQDGIAITDKILGLKPTLSDVEIKIEGGIGRPPLEQTPRNQALWKLARSKALLLGLSLEEAMAGGGSDGNTTSSFTATLDGLGTTGDGAHASHEYIFADQLVERTALLALLLLSNSIEKDQ